MKQSISHKVFSTVLSFLVLASTLSLTIEKHFCGGVLIDVAVFTEVEKCANDVLSESDSTQIVKKSCCKDEVDVFEGISEMIKDSFEDLDDIQKQVLFAYAHSYISLYESLPKQIIAHKDYSPPKLIKDIQVLNETFLI